jgi:Methyltransferase domain
VAADVAPALSRSQKIARLLRALATDPIGVSRALPGEYRQTRGTLQYGDAEVEPVWNRRLHALLGAPWPCLLSAELDDLMVSIAGLLAASGVGFGRGTYGWYSDADISLCRAVWCAVRHLRPEAVVETGVAHGVTSRVVLEALRQNQFGHLWSIDLPHPLDHSLHAQTGVAVTEECRYRWTYLEGASRRRLPRLLGDLGEVAVFIHDSLHTARNTLFEMEKICSVMPAGVMLIDDIKSHDGFATFAARHPGYQTMVCHSADRIGMFGIAVRAPVQLLPRP